MPELVVTDELGDELSGLIVVAVELGRESEAGSVPGGGVELGVDAGEVVDT